MVLARKLVAELLGTYWLTFGGCGSAVFAAAWGTTDLGIGFLGVSLAFGLTVLTMAYAIGHISGCHLNPAVSVGLAVGGRFDPREIGPYTAAQTVGAVLAGATLFFLCGQDGTPVATTGAGAFATNGYGAMSPGGYSMAACFVGEVVLTAFFLLIILGATDKRAPNGFAPLPIGLGLTLIHLIGIPLTNLSVNPARSTGMALFVPHAIPQLWLFWVAPIVGAAVGAGLYRFIGTEEPVKA